MNRGIEKRLSRSSDKDNKHSEDDDDDDDDDSGMNLADMKHGQMDNSHSLSSQYFHSESKKPKVKKQTEQKRVITNFVKAITSPTLEARSNLHHSKQCSQPLDKAKLLELFFTFLRFDPPVSASVFWKYVKREVYPDRNVFRNRKTGGYKGFSGVQFRHPDNPVDLEQLMHRLTKIESHLAETKESVISTLREVAQSTTMKKDHGNRKKKRSALDANLDIDVGNMYIESQKLDMSQAQMMPSMSHHPIHVEDMDGHSQQQGGLMDVQQSMVNNQFIAITQYLTPTAIEVIKLLNDPNVLSVLQNLRRIGAEQANNVNQSIDNDDLK